MTGFEPPTSTVTVIRPFWKKFKFKKLLSYTNCYFLILWEPEKFCRSFLLMFICGPSGPSIKCDKKNLVKIQSGCLDIIRKETLRLALSSFVMFGFEF